MVRVFKIVSLGAVAFILLSGQSVTPISKDYSTYGTLIGVLGNKNGVVVFTDSRATYRDGRGVLHRKPGDFQKLLQFDERTICAIAGLGSAKVHVAAELDADLLGVIQSYSDESRKHQMQSLESTLKGLSYALTLYLDGIAEINAQSGFEAEVANYHLQVLLAGYDLDGILKIGELELKVVQQSQPNGKPRWVTSVLWLRVDNVQDHFTSVIGGMNDVAKDALDHPRKFRGYNIFQSYATAMENQTDRGASLSTDDLDELGRALISLTSEKHREEVGGARQIAVLAGAHVARVSQPGFPPPHRPFPMLIMRDSLLSYPPFPRQPPFVIIGNPVIFYDSVTFIGEAADPVKRGHMSLDRAIFVNCTFRNMVLWYDGGSVYFDSTNRVADSQLALNRHATDYPDRVHELYEKFVRATENGEKPN